MVSTNQIVAEYTSNPSVQLSELSKKHLCSVDVVRRILINHNVWTQKKQHRCALPELEVLQAYMRDVSIDDIAATYGVSTSPIVAILNKHGMRKPVWAKMLPYNTYIKLADKREFENIVHSCISKKAIAEHLGINYDMVVSVCKMHQIQLPTSAGVRSLINQRFANYKMDKDTFVHLYYTQREPLADIASGMGVSVGYLMRVSKQWRCFGDRDSIQLSPQFLQLKDAATYDPALLQRLLSNSTITQLVQQYDVSWEVFRSLLTVHNIPITPKYRSTGEKNIEDFIRSCYGGMVVVCDRKNIPPYELDLVMPDAKVAIEYCGLYWHSELRGKDNTYHLEKLKRCEASGLRLLTIFEDEYQNFPELVHNRIKQALGVFDAIKINARQCDVREITPAVKNNFLRKYHIQGADVCKKALGLFYGDTLMSVMTFSSPSAARSSVNMRTPGVWELNRYATDYSYSVRGGAGKLLAHFKKHHEWKQIYSYADRRWSVGNVYDRLGFRLDRTSPPNYWYVMSGRIKREYRYSYAKYKLVKAGFDPTMTEQQIMQSRGYTRIWDCGMLKYVTVNDGSV